MCLNDVMIMDQVLYKTDSSQCPDPIGMIPFWHETKDKWPTTQTCTGDNRRGGTVGCLRQTKDYSVFLFHFARCMLSAKTFDMECKNKNLSQMMGPTCEAFAVIDYANNYVSWKNECRQEMGEEVSDVTEASSGSIKPYTSNAGAQGKYRGWSGEGLELYHRIVELLEEQRKSQKHGVVFEGQLRKKWKEGGGRKRQRDGGDVEDAPRAPNHCRLFLEMKGLL